MNTDSLIEKSVAAYLYKRYGEKSGSAMQGGVNEAKAIMEIIRQHEAEQRTGSAIGRSLPNVLQTANQLVSSEIPEDDIEQLAVSRIATWLYQSYAIGRPYGKEDADGLLDMFQAQARELWALVRHYPRKTEPVSVSLEKLGEVAWQEYQKGNGFKHVAKAILDAIGVRYVD